VVAVGALVAIALLWAAFRRVDPTETGLILQGLGPMAVLLLAPSAAAVTLEVFAWQRALGIMGWRTALPSLLRVRVASESLGATLPLGAIWSEAVKPHLLGQHCGLPFSVGVVGVTARKYLLILSQAGYLLLGLTLGHSAIRAGFDRATGRPVLALVLGIGVVALALIAEFTLQALRGGRTFQRVLASLARIPSAGLRARLASLAAECEHTDTTAVRFFGAGRGTLLGLAGVCLAGWLFEATETWLVLHAVGSSIAWGDALGVEAVVVLGRHIFAVLPGGLGVQELGYTTFLSGAFGDVNACAAFALLKRLRELVWVGLGYALLAYRGNPAAIPARVQEPRLA
jgi:uncharacterized membrane protein YbhN (UPF0104 family)